ncbi:MAG TPA: DUF2062 domain-containing protein [Firmicutes bacterium]|nr:MAG: hypothetical protein DRH44_01070 [Candidatus Coatesbacteria bacterium]HDM42804.1 DUF2062 domain-containing protein [Bacillota bacterium]
MKGLNWLKGIYRNIITQDAEPSKIATGASVGVFIGIFPTFGLGAVIAVALGWVFKYNRASAIIGSAIMNPITSPLFWSISFTIGVLIWGGDVKYYTHLWHEKGIMAVIKEGALVYLTGNIIVSILLSTITWFLVYYGARRVRRERLGGNDIKILK